MAKNLSLILLFLFTITISGCTNLLANDNKANSTAITIALNYPDIASELANSNNDYAVKALPSDPAIRGYYSYSGNLYDVTIDMANLGPSGLTKNYLGHYNLVVDVDRQQVMATQYSYDVAIMPWHILLPAHAIWYQRLNPSNAYVEMKLDTLNQSIRPMVLDYGNIRIMQDGRPYMAFWLSELDENATTIDIGGIHTAIPTFLGNVTVIPGRMPFPGNFINGSGVSFTFNDPGREYYFVLVNNGSTDATVDVIVQ